MNAIRILVVDDEPKYARAIRAILTAKGYEVLTADDGRVALEVAAREQPHLVLLDVRMPRLDGYEACRRLREFSTAPVIMLTAMAETADKVKGLELGADDYMTKPFSTEELVARVKAALRRSESTTPTESPATRCLGALCIDFVQQRVYVNDREVSLTATEYRLLREFVQHAEHVLSAEYLLNQVWGPGYEGEERLVWREIHRLRQKLAPDPGGPQYIFTRPGSGYVLQVD